MPIVRSLTGLAEVSKYFVSSQRLIRREAVATNSEGLNPDYSQANDRCGAIFTL